MDNQKNVKTFSRSVKLTERRSRALLRLESQLESGTKPDSETDKPIELGKKDITRIKNEIETLKARV